MQEKVLCATWDLVKTCQTIKKKKFSSTGLLVSFLGVFKFPYSLAKSYLYINLRAMVLSYEPQWKWSIWPMRTISWHDMTPPLPICNLSLQHIGLSFKVPFILMFYPFDLESTVNQVEIVLINAIYRCLLMINAMYLTSYNIPCQIKCNFIIKPPLKKKRERIDQVYIKNDRL